jgi:hypothetical protein
MGPHIITISFPPSQQEYLLARAHGGAWQEAVQTQQWNHRLYWR